MGWKALVIAGAIVVVALYMLFAPRGVPVQSAQVTEGRVSAYVEETAITALPHIHKLSMPLDGRIMPITLLPGTPVKAGEIVAKLDVADLETVIAENTALMKMADASIALNKYNEIEETAIKESEGWISTMADTVAAALKKAKASKARNDFAQWNLQSAEKMKQAISEKELNLSRAAAAEAQMEHEADMLIYNATKTIQSIFTLAPVYINQYLTRKTLDRDILLAQREAAKARLEKARRDLKRAVIASPIDGIVLKRHHQNETMLNAGALLIEIGNPALLEISSDILSRDAMNIRVGNRVDIYGGALGTTEISGVVTGIEPRAFTKISSLGVEEQRVKVTIAFASESRQAELGVSYRLYVRIHTAEYPKALKIPRTALFRGSGGEWQVFRIVNGRCRLTSVETGLKNDREVQIIKGLEATDEVIMAPPASLKDGIAVKEKAGLQYPAANK